MSDAEIKRKLTRLYDLNAIAVHVRNLTRPENEEFFHGYADLGILNRSYDENGEALFQFRDDSFSMLREMDAKYMGDIQGTTHYLDLARMFAAGKAR